MGERRNAFQYLRLRSAVPLSETRARSGGSVRPKAAAGAALVRLGCLGGIPTWTVARWDSHLLWTVLRWESQPGYYYLLAQSAVLGGCVPLQHRGQVVVAEPARPFPYQRR